MTNAEAEPTLTEKQKMYIAILRALTPQNFLSLGPKGMAFEQVFPRMTPDAIAAQCKYSANSIATRLPEMRKLGYVEGYFKPGARFKEWFILEKGQEVLTKLKK